MPAKRTADVVVVGCGLIALAIAAELAERGVRTIVVGTTHHGEASSAAAGMLAPGTEADDAAAYQFAAASRDLYPAYLATLRDHTGIAVPLNRLGILQVAYTPAELATLHARWPASGHGAREEGAPERLSAADVAALEPALARSSGGMRHPDDGCVDSLALLDALRLWISRRPEVTVRSENVRRIQVHGADTRVTTDGENHLPAHRVVLAAGAWSAGIAGAPHARAVQPVRGQMVAFHGCVLRHVVYGPSGYLVPKADGHTLAGSTMEHVGFAAQTTDDGIAAVRDAAVALAPALASARVCARWAGLRPVTPDGLPLLGEDPDAPGLVYACGHSRNGVLLAPLTAAVIADLVTGVPPRHDLARFRPDRF